MIFKFIFLFLLKVQKIIFGFLDKTFLSSQGKLYYLDNKNIVKPVLILVHGFSDIPENMIRSCLSFKQDFHIILPALKGFDKDGVIEGESYSLGLYADQIIELMDSYKVDKFIIGGNSLGGATAMQVYKQAPSRVEKLIIMDSAGFEFDDIDTITTKVKAGGRNPFFIENEEQFDAFMRELFYKEPGELGIFKKVFLEKYISQRSAYEYLAAQLFLENKDEKFLIEPEKLEVETLIVWGEYDEFFPKTVAEKVHAAAPNSKLAIIKNSGHLPHLERPSALGRVLKDFLN